MDFIAIDFETATSDRNSPCEIGLTFVKNKAIIDTKSWLIKPIYKEFNKFNKLIHGITENDVSNSPEFDSLWGEIKPLIDGQLLIAHNAAFDFSVLRNTLQTYKIPFPNLEYLCSYNFSKRIWKDSPSFDLNTLCKINKIPLQRHHRAASDSLAAALLSLKAFDAVGISCSDDVYNKLKIASGRLSVDGYEPCRCYKLRKPIAVTTTSTEEDSSSLIDEDSIFYQKSIVFTGTLSSMSRNYAQKTVSDIGGVVGNSVSKKTDFLIVGQQDYRLVGEDGMSSKQEKAMQLISKGHCIEIMSESEFLQHL